MMRTEATETIRQRLNITAERLYMMQFNAAYHYMMICFNNDEEAVANYVASPIFWQFWLEQWAIIDSVIYHKDYTLNAYRALHYEPFKLRNDDIWYNFENNYELMLKKINYGKVSRRQKEAERSDQGREDQNSRVRVASI